MPLSQHIRNVPIIIPMTVSGFSQFKFIVPQPHGRQENTYSRPINQGTFLVRNVTA